MKKADVTKRHRLKESFRSFVLSYATTSEPFCVPVMLYKILVGVSGFYTHACFLIAVSRRKSGARGETLF